jgi:hypothetical protein
MNLSFGVYIRIVRQKSCANWIIELMSRAAGPALGVRRSAFRWIVSECSLTRLGPSKVLVNSRRLMGSNAESTQQLFADEALGPSLVPGLMPAHSSRRSCRR